MGGNLIGLLVSVAIMAVLAVWTVLTISAGKNARALEKAKTEIFQTESNTSYILSFYLNKAQRIVGPTEDEFAGIERYPNTIPTESDRLDGLSLIVSVANAINIPAQLDETSKGFKLPKPDDEKDNLSYDLFKELLAKDRSDYLLLVTTPTETHVVNPTGASLSESSDKSYMIFKPENLVGPKLTSTHFVSQAASLSLANRITISIDNGEFKVSDGFKASRTVATGVESSLFRYSYASYGDASDKNLYKPPAPLRHHKEPFQISLGSGSSSQVNCPGSPDCPKSHNLFKVTWDAVIRYDGATFNKGDIAESTDGDESTTKFFIGDDGKLRAKIHREYYPNAFRAAVDTSTVMQSIDAACLPSNLKPQRCKDRCDYAFDSPNRNSESWRGYKKGSPWCECGTRDTDNKFVDDYDRMDRWNVGDVNFPHHDYNTAKGRERLEACFEAWGCTEGFAYKNWWIFDIGVYTKFNHPAAYIACHCTQPQALASNSESNWFTHSLIEGDGLYNSHISPDLRDPTPLIETSKKFADENIYCSGDRTSQDYACGAAFNAWAKSQNVSNPLGDESFKEHCMKCRTGNRNTQGQLDNTYPSWWMDWDSVCNSNIDMAANTGDLTCGNTMKNINGKYEYRRRDVPGSDERYDSAGLDMYEEMFCRCLRERNNPDIAAHEGLGGWNGKKWAEYWMNWDQNQLKADFRDFQDNPSIPNDVLTVDGEVIPLRSKQIMTSWNGNFDIGSAASGGYSCTNLAHEYFATHTSCVPEPRTAIPGGHAVQNPLYEETDWARDAGIQTPADFRAKLIAEGGNPATYDSAPQIRHYCKSTCWLGGGQDAKVEKIRKIALGTPAGQSLPEWCGGPKKGGGSVTIEENPQY